MISLLVHHCPRHFINASPRPYSPKNDGRNEREVYNIMQVCFACTMCRVGGTVKGMNIRMYKVYHILRRAPPRRTVSTCLSMSMSMSMSMSIISVTNGARSAISRLASSRTGLLLLRARTSMLSTRKPLGLCFSRLLSVVSCKSTHSPAAPSVPCHRNGKNPPAFLAGSSTSPCLTLARAMRSPLPTVACSSLVSSGDSCYFQSLG